MSIARGLIDQIITIDKRIGEIKVELKALRDERTDFNADRCEAMEKIREILIALREQDGIDVEMEYRGCTLSLADTETKKPKKKKEKVESVKEVLDRYGLDADVVVDEVFSAMASKIVKREQVMMDEI